ncbi:hypothetical protein ACRALDRAFT_2140959 [Sodiomyces alcalophilus JCM 7366]|uniref:uncharacterized protein n=1 Tax=Sodiomyces alcalophilus JCM 7366 TaxID=591952 RepID=UPI0039B4DDD3
MHFTTPSGATLIGGLPSSTLFSLPTGQEPLGVPPPLPGATSSSAFHIPDHIYTAVLDAKVPLTIATLYAVTVTLLNRYNTSRDKRPWALSKTKPFRVFVVVHNLLLAVYSAWTFWGMLGGMRRSVVSPMGPHGLAATADSLCQVNGPPGLGHATVYSDTLGQWTSFGGSVPLGADGAPSRDVYGRLWNEGLAFYGWIFYLSKFYEVLDTFIILAKGKLSSTLQTYHHAGAMMCMWAGMRYMSAPIWIFVLVNSFIHALMYTYYTLTSFNIRVPTPIKRSLTTMQIMQFVLGASFAMLHSFVSYTIPMTVPVDDHATNAAAAAASSPAAVASPAPTAEGAASSSSSHHHPTETVFVTQPCITTSGETFAIWLNVFYLAPLTYLFVMFFIRSYIRRSTADSSRQVKGKPRRRESNVTLAEKAGWDAARDVNREIYNDGTEDGAAEKANGKVKH